MLGLAGLVAARATRTGCSSAAGRAHRAALVTMGHAGRGRRAGSPTTCAPARRPAGAAAQRAQVRPGPPAAAGARARVRSSTTRRSAGPREPARATRPSTRCRPDHGSGARRHRVLAVVGAAAARRRSAGSRPPGVRRACPTTGSRRAAWLERHDEPGTALLVPGLGVRRPTSGVSPRDEPMQSLARLALGGAQRRPAGPAGNIRMLDAIERRLAQGARLGRAAPLPRRAGVTPPGVRNDLTAAADVPDPVLVHQALDGSPGLDRVADVRPDGRRRGAHRPARRARIADQRRLAGRATRAVEVYAVDGARRPDGRRRLPTGRRWSSAAPRTCSTSPTSGVARRPSRPSWRRDADADGVAAGRWSSPTGCARSSATSAGCTTATSPTLGARRPDAASASPSRDYLPDQAPSAGRPAPGYVGSRSVTASSSLSDANALGGRRSPAACPTPRSTASPDTAWVPTTARRGSPWWQLDLGRRPRPSTRSRVTAGAEAARSSGCGPRRGRDDRAGRARRGQHPHRSRPGADGPSWIRVEDASGRPGDAARRSAEVAVPGVRVAPRARAARRCPTAWGAPTSIVAPARSTTRAPAAPRSTAPCGASPAARVAAEEPAGFARGRVAPAARTTTPA